MRNGFSAIVEKDGAWYIAYCPEIPGANGQGQTKEECLRSLSEAISLILEDRREDALRGYGGMKRKEDLPQAGCFRTMTRLGPSHPVGK